MLISFEGKRVIVAGAGRGIGQAIAIAFAESGAAVIACDRLSREVEHLAGPAKSGGGMIRAAKVDVTDKASVEAVVAQAGGTVDVLVYVAGGIRGQHPKPLEDVSVEDFHQIVDANLTGAFLFAQAVAPGMKRAGKGRIVTISSRAAIAPSLTGIQSLRGSQARPTRPRPPTRPGIGPVRDHGEHRCARIPPHQPRLRAAMGSGGVLRARSRSSSGSPCAEWERRMTSRMLSCSWLRIMLPGSRDRSCP